jgi:hypothetical protein
MDGIKGIKHKYQHNLKCFKLLREKIKKGL